MPRTAEELENDGHGVVNQSDVPEVNKTVTREQEEHLEKYGRLSSVVSLRSCMQSNVPEPFNPHGRNPTHLNMPGGGVKLQDKFVSGELIRLHPRRQFSTQSCLFMSQAAEEIEPKSYADLPCPQGVQGYDCIRFKLWLQNCQRFNMDCDQQIDDFQSGRKTLAQIFEEQEIQIKSVAAKQRKEVEMFVDHQGVQSEEFARVDRWVDDFGPSAQGIQGSECHQFKEWLKNCISYNNIGDCNRQLDDLKSGRKTLNQIFREQEEMIKSRAYVPRRQYCTSHGGSHEVSKDNDPVKPQLTQRQKLKSAVKDYGATVIVFHVGISLMSLGGFYLAVSRY